MSAKAKTLDRLELTRQKFSHLRVSTNPEVRDERPASFGVSECPVCGRQTLKHEGGCTICTSCGWSACG